MVFLTEICLKYMPFWLRGKEQSGPYFKRQAFMRLTGIFYGKNRNCYRVAVRKVTKRMQYGVRERQVRADLISDTLKQRILCAVEEHDFKIEYFVGSLQKCGIELNNKSLAHLATYEPRTFKCLVDIAKTKFKEEDSEVGRSLEAPDGVITRGML